MNLEPCFIATYIHILDKLQKISIIIKGVLTDCVTLFCNRHCTFTSPKWPF